MPHPNRAGLVGVTHSAIRILFPLIAILIAVAIPCQANAAGQSSPTGVQGGDSGIEVKLILAPDEKLSRALELSRAVREAAHVDRITYAVSDEGRESALITHNKDSSTDSIAALMSALTEQMVNDVIVKVRTPDAP